jgi:quinol monooxygenase YgiN
MHVIIVKWVIKPEHVAAFLDTMRWHIEATRKSEKGCLQFDLCRDSANERCFWLYEVYRDDAALAEHAKSPSLPKLREKIPEWVEERVLVNATRLTPETV